MLIFTDGQLDDAHHDIRMALSKVWVVDLPHII
jgi:hypothetical protein